MKITTFLLSFCLFAMGVSTQSLAKIKEVNVANLSIIATDPIMPILSNLYACDYNYDGFATFDLTTQTPIILAAQSGASANYSVSYYLSQSNANTGTNPISNPSAYTNLNNQQVIYVKVVNNGTAQYAVGVFALMVNNPVVPMFPQNITICQGDAPPVLPTVSTNGIAGTWSPSTIDTTYPGAYIFTFTPNPGQCSTTVTTAIFVNPSPVIYTPANFVTCDTDGTNDGYYHYSLSALIPGILGGQNPSDFTVTFYNNQASANSNTNAITNLSNYQTYTHNIWFRVTSNASGCYKISSFYTEVEQLPSPEIFTDNNINSFCVDYLTNTMTSTIQLQTLNLTSYLFLQNNISTPTYTYQWYLNGVPILGATNSVYSVPPFLNASSGSFSVRMISSSNCASVLSSSFEVLQSGSASPIGVGYTIVNNAGNQTITVEVEGYGVYKYSLDDGPAQFSPIFSNVSIGLHTITIFDTVGGMYSCSPLVISNIDVNLTTTPPPTGNTSQSFSQGATLANVQVSGQNIQWYSGANKMASSSPLPLSTILVNGATYYASQKIGGYESTTRLPVTVQLNLSNSQFETNGFSYYPNPVENTLNINSDSIIDSVTVYNVLGQLILTKRMDTSNAKLDLSTLKSGSYFVKIVKGDKVNSFKIIKE